jgi:hypothetical protein
MPGELIPGRPSKDQLLDPTVNVQTGCSLLAELMKAQGTQATALAAYYGGIYLGRPTDEGWSYIRLVEAAAQKYRDWDMTADDDFLQYAPSTSTWRECAINLLGIATDALEKGRQLKAALMQIRDSAAAAADVWGNM